MDTNYYYDTTSANRPYTHAVEATPGTLPPANALRIAPEFRDGYWPCEHDGKWLLVEDHRGKTVYATANATQNEEVKTVGPVEEGYTLQKPPSQWASWNGQAWEDGKPPVYVLTKRQVKLALAADGKLSGVLVKVRALDEIDAVRINWEDSDSFARDNDFIVWLAQNEKIDVGELFEKGSVL